MTLRAHLLAVTFLAIAGTGLAAAEGDAPVPAPTGGSATHAALPPPTEPSRISDLSANTPSGNNGTLKRGNGNTGPAVQGGAPQEGGKAEGAATGSGSSPSTSDAQQTGGTGK